VAKVKQNKKHNIQDKALLLVEGFGGNSSSKIIKSLFSTYILTTRISSSYLI
jgi:hypothetical protein